jgi:hypothetical protein
MTTTIFPPTMSWAEIKSQFSNEWVVLGNPIFHEMEITSGIVIAHHADKRIACLDASVFSQEFEKITVVFIGKLPKSRRIGLLSRVNTSVGDIHLNGSKLKT